MSTSWRLTFGVDKEISTTQTIATTITRVFHHDDLPQERSTTVSFLSVSASAGTGRISVPLSVGCEAHRSKFESCSQICIDGNEVREGDDESPYCPRSRSGADLLHVARTRHSYRLHSHGMVVSGGRQAGTMVGRSGPRSPLSMPIGAIRMPVAYISGFETNSTYGRYSSKKTYIVFREVVKWHGKGGLHTLLF